MTLITKEELSAYQFNLLPNVLYVEIDNFTVRGRSYKLVLAAPTDACQTGKFPSYVVVIGMVDSSGTQKWLICPWLNDEICGRLASTVAPSVAATRLPQDLRALLTTSPLPAPAAPGQGQTGTPPS